MAVHRDNAALMDGLLRSASLLMLASVKLPESVASALSADRAKPVRQTGSNVNRRKGNDFMCIRLFLNEKFEVVPMRGHTSGVNADCSDQTDAEPRQ